MHEIITLQFGQKANFLATHFWNAQESYFTYNSDATPSPVDHDIHFRPGIGTDGSETYTPRTVVYDFKANFGSLRRINSLYDDIGDGQVRGLWDTGRTVTHRQDPVAPTAYQRNLDLGMPTSQLYEQDVRYWSDFNRVFYHPRSIVQLSEYSLSAELEASQNWQTGQDLWREVDRETEESILDRDVRLFVEESDQLQGFQIFSGVDDVWGGFANRYTDALIDEFGKKSVWMWAIEDGQRTDRQKILAKAANAARSLNEISAQVSAYVRCSTQPYRLPTYFNLHGNSLWESTAAIEAAVESITLPTRLRSGEQVKQGSMSLSEHVLNTNGGQKIFDLAASFKSPLGMQSKQRMDAIANGNRHVGSMLHEDAALEVETFDVSYTPSFHELASALPTRPRGDNNPNHDFAQLQCNRGDHHTIVNHGLSHGLDADERMRRRQNEEAIIEKYEVPLPFSHLDTFPNNMIQVRNEEGKRVGWDQVVVYSGLTCTSSMKRTIFELRDVVTRGSRILEMEEKEDLYNGLTELGEQYAFGWEDDSDEEDD